jgi:hypothetical protein
MGKRQGPGLRIACLYKDFKQHATTQLSRKKAAQPYLDLNVGIYPAERWS